MGKIADLCVRSLQLPRVKTFMEFVTESLATSFSTSEGYCEVFRNPSMKELSIAAEASSGGSDGSVRNFTGGYSSPSATGYITVAGAMTDATLYVWNRDLSMHMPAIRTIAKDEKLPLTTLIPIYIDFKKNQVAVRYAAYSGQNLYHKLTDRKVVAMAKKHPAFKTFTMVDGF